MTEAPIVFVLFLVFTGTALLAALALYGRQSLLIAYVVAGLVAGPEVLDAIPASVKVRDVGQVGIIFLLFLLGLNLHPQKLARLLGPATRVTLAGALIVMVAVTPFCLWLGFGLGESLFVSLALGFSSTIIGLKLLPTTALHHRHLGEIIISILLLQDMIAIVMLLGVQAAAHGGDGWLMMLLPIVALPALAVACWALSRYVLIPLLMRFDTIAEYLFLATIGWCLGIAELAHLLGLSHEMGAFVAGVTLAANPVATYIAETLKPLRDFFLILFFFALGAEFPLTSVSTVVVPGAALAALVMLCKIWGYRVLLVRTGETPRMAREVGVRLGQASEFTLLVVVLAVAEGVISESLAHLVQAATLFTFIASSYVVMNRYPTPIAVNERLRQS
ncbi:MAG: cation:proton antiporter [Pseudomonadota bacterium]